MAVTIKKKEDKVVEWLLYDMMMVDGQFRTRLISEDGKMLQTIFAGQDPIIEDL